MLRKGFQLNIRGSVEVEELLKERRMLAMLESTGYYLGSILDEIYYKCYGMQNVKKAEDINSFVY